MKKNLVRIVALLLVAMLALTLLPLGAIAVEYDVWEYIVDSDKPKWSDAPVLNPIEYVNNPSVSKVTIKASDYESYLKTAYGDYDLKGFIDYTKTSGKYIKTVSKLNIEGVWPYYVDLLYTPHQHKLTCWISDGTTHWKNCTVCREKFIHQNWCQDGDEDRICNVCGGDVPYHDVTVIESEGGKITVNKDLASHRTKITADVEVADGYKLKKLHFTKIRDDGSRQEITRYKKDGQFWTRMPTYELEVSAEFVKK